MWSLGPDRLTGLKKAVIVRNGCRYLQRSPGGRGGIESGQRLPEFLALSQGEIIVLAGIVQRN